MAPARCTSTSPARGGRRSRQARRGRGRLEYAVGQGPRLADPHEVYSNRPPLCLSNACASGCSLRPGRQPNVKPAAPFSRHHSHDCTALRLSSWRSTSVEICAQRQPSVRHDCRHVLRRLFVRAGLEAPAGAGRGDRLSGAAARRLILAANMLAQRQQHRSWLMAQMLSDSAVVRPMAPRVHSDEKNTAKDDGENENQDHIY